MRVAQYTALLHIWNMKSKTKFRSNTGSDTGHAIIIPWIRIIIGWPGFRSIRDLPYAYAFNTSLNLASTPATYSIDTIMPKRLSSQRHQSCWLKHLALVCVIPSITLNSLLCRYMIWYTSIDHEHRICYGCIGLRNDCLCEAIKVCCRFCLQIVFTPVVCADYLI